MHGHPLALEDATAWARVDGSEPLPGHQCGNQAAPLGLEARKQNPSSCAEQALIVEDLRLSGRSSCPCKQFLGEIASAGGSKAPGCSLTSTSTCSQLSITVVQVSQLCTLKPGNFPSRPAWSEKQWALPPIPLGHGSLLYTSDLCTNKNKTTTKTHLFFQVSEAETCLPTWDLNNQ